MAYYMLQGKTVVSTTNVVEWGAWLSSADRRIAVSDVGPLRVSTIFLSGAEAFEDPPHLFETMIFDREVNSFVEHYCERCSTYKEAEEQHVQAVNIARIAADGL